MRPLLAGTDLDAQGVPTLQLPTLGEDSPEGMGTNLETPPFDLRGMTLQQIKRLTDAELAPVIRAGYRAMGQELTDEAIKENIDAIRWGHWVPGLPRQSESDDLEAIGL